MAWRNFMVRVADTNSRATQVRLVYHPPPAQIGQSVHFPPDLSNPQTLSILSPEESSLDSATPPSPLAPSIHHLSAMASRSFFNPPSGLIRSDSFTSLRQPGRITPVRRPASTGTIQVAEVPKVIYHAKTADLPASMINRLIRKRPTSTLLIMGDLPSQILELSSDSSASSRDDHRLSPALSPVIHRAICRVPRQTRTTIRTTVPPPPPSRESSPVSLPDVPAPSPYRTIRRTQSDQFDQEVYERTVVLLASEEAGAQEEDGRWGGSSGCEGSSEASPATKTRKGERALLMADEEQRVIRRVMDRSILIEELFRESAPAPPRRLPLPQYGSVRQPSLQHMQRVSRRPNLPTITSNRVLQQPQGLRPCPLKHRIAIPKTPESRSHSGSRNTTFTQTPGLTPPSDPVVTPPSSNTLPSEGEEGRCDACGRDQNQGRKMRMMPCAHIVCSTCFSSSISAVSVTHGPSRCTTCLDPVVSFEPVKAFQAELIRVNHDDQDERHPPTTPPKQATQIAVAVACAGVDPEEDRTSTVVLRIDNVAWDITPSVVESFLPADVLPLDHVSPVHILLDRQDGRTKDFLYVEVKSLEAARLILKTRQNTLMPCGPASAGRKRFVTISLTTHKELLDELRPKTSAELHSLLKLCQASILTAHPATSAHGLYVGYNGIAHFVKDRHGPFYALMSILCHLSGQNSPAYWDLFHVISGALAALANVIGNRNQSFKPNSSRGDPVSDQTIKADQDLLDKLRYLFRTHFSLTPTDSPC